MVHVRFDGRSFDVPERALHLTHAPGDVEIKRRLAEHLDVRVEALRDYAVDRRPGGDLVVRPEAVYG
jgi:hypothetical protein